MTRHCGKCGVGHERTGQRYCADCHAAYMREWRKTHTLSPAAQSRDDARHVAARRKSRGTIVPRPCQVCGDDRVEMHHIDHEKPFDVTWLCRKHHLEWHMLWRRAVMDIFTAWLHGDISYETFSEVIPDGEARYLSLAVADLSDELARMSA